MNLANLTEEIQTLVGSERDGNYGIETATAILKKLRTSGAAPTTVVPVGPEEITDTDFVDERSEKVFATLQKEVQPYMRSLIHAAAKQGMVVKALSGLRTYAEQEEVFSRGKSKAHGGFSNHNFGIACDFGIFVEGKYIDDEVDAKRMSSRTMDAMYSSLGVIGRELGLDWGGDWHSFVDMPHFQLRPKWAKTLSENAMLAELRRRKDIDMPYYA